jgi:hypothetical protein
MWNRRHRWIRRFAAGLAFAALAVPTAQAGIVEDSGVVAPRQEVVADFKGNGYYTGTPVGIEAGAPVLPDDRAVRFTPEAGNPDVVASSGSFDWSDAAIGGGSTLALMLLALGAAYATRNGARKSLAGA